MANFTQRILKPGFYRVRGEMQEFTRDRIAAYCSGTRSALKAGLSIPVLRKHDYTGNPCCGPLLSKTDATDGCGWLTGVVQHKDGSMSQKLDITDPEAAEGISNGSIKFSSPQFLESYLDGDGVQHGAIVRHVALTPTPRTKHQGPIVEDTEQLNAISFSEDDYLGSTIEEAQAAMTSFADDNKKKPVEIEDAGTPTSEPTADPETNEGPPAENATEVETEETNESPTAELVGKLVQFMGIEIADVNDIPSVLTAVLNMVKSGAMKKAEEKEELQPQEEPAAPTSFSEEEQEYVNSLHAQVTALQAESKSRAAKSSRIATQAKIAGMGLPPAARKRLDTAIASTSFSDDGAAKPMFDVLQVAEIIKEAMPKGLSFAADETTEEKHPDGDEFLTKEGESTLTDDEHTKAAKEQLARHGHLNTKDLQPA